MASTEPKLCVVGQNIKKITLKKCFHENFSRGEGGGVLCLIEDDNGNTISFPCVRIILL